MKLIQEADNDEMFNKHMMKIQDAIEALEKMADKIELPVSSQVRMLEVSSKDLDRLAFKLTRKRQDKGLK